MQQAFDDDEITELERRLDELERTIFDGADSSSSSTATSSAAQTPPPPAFEMLESLEARVAELETGLNPSVHDLVPGSECLAYSIADGSWLECRVEAVPAAHARGGAYSVTFAASGQRRQVLADQVRPLGVDPHAVSSAEDAVRALAARHRGALPGGGALDGGAPLPLGVPLGPEAQRALVLEAAPDLLRGTRALEALFGGPGSSGKGLVAAVNSPALAELPSLEAQLRRLEAAASGPLRRAAAGQAAEAQALVDGYCSAVALLNAKAVEWDEKVAAAERRHRQQQEKQLAS